jgi:CheY-like chemotaxis protein
MTKTGNILLADDDPVSVELALEALSEVDLGASVAVVSDGEEALDYLYCRRQYEGRMEGHPNLILLDLKMPKVTGLEVLQQIKSDPALESIPVVIVTSAQDKTELQACFDLGINSWFRKPPEFAEFGKAVKEILEADDPSESQR